MGWRTVEFQTQALPSRAVLSWIREFAAYARWSEVDTTVRRKREDGRVSFEFTVHGNSGYLNFLTNEFTEVALQIAIDIAPHDSDLLAIAVDAGEQLHDQKIVNEPGEIVFLPTRASREGSERLSGEASMDALMQELAIHERRLSADLKGFNDAAGPKAWKRRLQLRFATRVDALAIINCARRVERIARDLQRRLNNNAHIAAALDVFQQATFHVTDLRNISEHLDEYVVGQGKIDARTSVEPGEVFEISMERDDVVLTARCRDAKILQVAAAVRELVRCVRHTTTARLMEINWADGVEFDYAIIKDDGTSRILRRDEYPPELLSALAATAESRKVGIPFSEQVSGNCPECRTSL